MVGFLFDLMSGRDLALLLKNIGQQYLKKNKRRREKGKREGERRGKRTIDMRVSNRDWRARKGTFFFFNWRVIAYSVPLVSSVQQCDQ